MTKKKTVKELNEDVKVLEDRVKQLEQIGKVFDMLNNVDVKELDDKIKMINEARNDSKIINIEKKINQLEDLMSKKQENSDMNVINHKEYSCKNCDYKVQDKSELKQHIKTKHPKEIKCKVCDETFDKTYKLELHLKNHEVECFKCKVCDKSFHLKWRLEKHESAHNLLNVKFCHYFNNGKQCPYEEVGCMFKHEHAERCRYNYSCKNKLCQFQHSNQETEKDDNDTSNTSKVDNNIDQESINGSNFDSDSEMEDFECDVCGTTFKDENELTEHQATGNCGYLCEPCGVAFKYEVHLKLHKEKHCTKCGDEFDIKVLEAHKTKCQGMVFDY